MRWNSVARIVVPFGSLVSAAVAQSCPGDPGIELLSSSAQPRIGDPFVLTTKTTIGDLVVLFISVGSGPTATPYGNLCVSLPAAIVTFPQLTTAVSLPANIPYAVGLAGQNIHFQFLSKAVGPGPVHRSNGAAITIENDAEPNFSGTNRFVLAAPGALAVGDLDSDGHLDVVVPCDGSPLHVGPGLQVGLGDGLGDFSVFKSYELGLGTFVVGPTKAAAIVDVNADGDMDILAVGTQGMYCLIADHSLQFVKTGLFAGVSDTTDLAVGDFDLDGKIDVALANASASAISVLPGTGSGLFAPNATVTTSASLGGIATADIDLDGDLDLAAAFKSGSGGGQLFMGMPGSTFAAGTAIATGAPNFDVEIADLDHVGPLDVVLTGGFPNLVSIFEMTTSTNSLTQLSLNGSPGGVIVTDLDANGALDILATYSNPTIPSLNGLAMYAGQGNGNFNSAIAHQTAPNPWKAAAGDLDGDGYPDVVTSRRLPNGIQIDLDRNGDGFGLSGSPDPKNTPSLSDAAIVDFDANGVGDVVAIDVQSPALRTFVGNGAGQFTAGSPVILSATPAELVTGDLDGDADDDLVITSQSVADTQVLRTSGTGSFVTSTLPTLVGGRVALGDLDSDSHLDIVRIGTPVGQSSAVLRAWLGNGAGSFTAATSQSTANASRDVALGDLDLDGVLDAVVTNGGQLGQQSFHGDGHGNFPLAVTWNLLVPCGACALGDRDLDGKLDLAVEGTLTTNELHLANGDGTLSFSSWTPISTVGTVSEVMMSDINGDSWLDLLYTTFDHNVLIVSYGDANGSLTEEIGFRIAMPNSRFGLGNLNGDARPDIVTAGASPTRSLSVLLHR